MSLELSPDRFEVRDDATGGLILDHATRLLPIVQKVAVTDIDVAFPDVSKGTAGVMSTGTTTVSGSTRGWRAYAYGLRINAGIQAGSINLAAIEAGLTPNFILGRFKCYRSVNPREDIFGPVIKSVPENKLISGRAGRLEFGAWLRRIFWIDIGDGYVRLNWKQSTRAYSPNHLDPNNVFFPDRYRTLERPPAYQLGSYYDYNHAGITDPPANFPPREIPESSWPQPPASVTFASTWRFSNIDLWLGQV